MEWPDESDQFSKIFTVEHSVRIFNIGRIQNEHIPRLLQCCHLYPAEEAAKGAKDEDSLDRRLNFQTHHSNDGVQNPHLITSAFDWVCRDSELPRNKAQHLRKSAQDLFQVPTDTD